MTVALDALVLRPGTLSDLPAVESFTRDTFSWGDYLSYAWSRWVLSRRGELIVAELEGEVVGTVHAQYLGEGEAWLEGLRVREDARRRGIASRLIEQVHARAAQRPNRVIRLETGSRNHAARAAFERHGYRLTHRFCDWEAAPLAEHEADLRPAGPRDLDDCVGLWERSPLRRAAHGLVAADYGWRWWCFSAARLARAIRERRVYLTPSRGHIRAFMVVRSDDEFAIPLLVGSPRASVALLLAARGLAHAAGRTIAYWLPPVCAASRHTAELAGFKLDDDGMLIYERAL